MTALLSFQRVEIVALASCLFLLAVVFELVRRGRIKERYSLLWFGTGASMLALTVKRDWLEKFAHAVGIYYSPSALFLLLSGFMIVILIHYSIVLSQLISQNQKLGQKVALMQAEIDEMKKTRSDRSGGGPEEHPFDQKSPKKSA